MRLNTNITLLFICSYLLLCSLVLSKDERKASTKGNKPKSTKSKRSSSSAFDWHKLNLRSVSPASLNDLSYLFSQGSSQNSIYTEVVKDLLYVIRQKQQLSATDCRNKRLLVVQMSSTSFEGLGSLIKQVQFAVAIAMHANRAIIWGYGYPFMFEHSKDVWDGPDRSTLRINDIALNCTQDDPLAGPIGCFFEPLTTCSLADISPIEMLDFSHNAWNESARVMLSEVRRGIALYHPPSGLMDYIIKERGYGSTEAGAIIERQAHLWAAAVTAYVFRIKPPIAEIFKARFQGYRGNVQSVWGLHVRHGDLKALSNVYGYKEVFDFEDYFSGAIQVSSRLKATPQRVFVSTDSMEADHLELLYRRFMSQRLPHGTTVTNSIAEEDDDEEDDGESEDEDNDEDDDDEEDEEEDYDDYEDFTRSSVSPSSSSMSAKQHNLPTWYNSGVVPSIFTISNSNRYRTEHGSHTVAANGGCQRDEKYLDRGMRCALNYQAIVHYQTVEEHRSVPRAYRLMRVMLEAVEDLYFLSQCDALVAQGSSHFSTLASLLIWARTGAFHLDKNILFLDQRKIEQGIIPTAFLHGMNLLNGTHSLDESIGQSGKQRWAIHSNYFLSGLPNKMTNTIRVSYNPWSDDNRIHLVNSLPHLPDKVFYTEVQHWLGGKYKPVWPGMCPGPHDGQHVLKWTPLEYITVLINEGVDHLSQSHEGQALQCWKDALQALDAFPNLDTPERMVEYRSIANENTATLRKLKYAEMIINENHSTREFLDYQERYMKKSTEEGKSDKKSLEDVNEEIAILEGKIAKLRALRDKLISANYVMLSGGIDDSQLSLPANSVRVRVN
eukprot:scaffold3412_cov171-Ochromonas_danica.AAC.1